MPFSSELSTIGEVHTRLAGRAMVSHVVPDCGTRYPEMSVLIPIQAGVAKMRERLQNDT